VPLPLKSYVPETYCVSVDIEPEDGDRASLRNTGSHSNSTAAVNPQELPCASNTFSYLSVRDVFPLLAHLTNICHLCNIVGMVDLQRYWQFVLFPQTVGKCDTSQKMTNARLDLQTCCHVTTIHLYLFLIWQTPLVTSCRLSCNNLPDSMIRLWPRFRREFMAAKSTHNAQLLAQLSNTRAGKHCLYT